MMVLLVVNGNHSPYHWAERCSLAEHFKDYAPGLVDDILIQLLAQDANVAECEIFQKLR